MRVAWVFVLVCAACNPDLTLGVSDKIACGDDGTCPKGFTCVSGGRCVDPALIDTAGARAYAPTVDEVVSAAEDVEFLWGVVTGASQYTLEVATDEAMTDIVITLQQPGIRSLQKMSAGTYYWRVSSDVSENITTAPSRFGVVEDAVYVYCPDSATCTSDPPAGLGTIASPVPTISEGIALAERLAIPRVRIAKRGDDSAYVESVTMVDNVSLQGGFDASFTAVSGRTPVDAGSRVLSAFSLLSVVSIEGMAFTRTADIADGSEVALFYECSPSLQIIDSSFNHEYLRAAVVRLEESNSTGPEFIDSEINGALPFAGDGSSASLVDGHSRGSVTLTRCALYGSIPSGATLTGVTGEDASINVTGSVIELSGGDDSVGVTARSGSSLHIEDTTFDIHGALVSGVGLATTDVEALGFVRNTVRVRDSQLAYGVTSSASSFAAITSVFASNLVEVAPLGIEGSDAVAMSIDGVNAAVFGNTLVVGQADATEVGLEVIGGLPRILNNMFIATGTACSSGPCHRGLWENPGASTESTPPASLLSNVFAGFASCPYYTTSCSTDLDSRSYSGFTPVFDGNASFSDATAIGLSNVLGADGLTATADDELVPSIVASIYDKGINTEANVCLPTDVSDGTIDTLFDAITVPNCGGAVASRDGTPSTERRTLGAYEASE